MAFILLAALLGSALAVATLWSYSVTLALLSAPFAASLSALLAGAVKTVIVRSKCSPVRKEDCSEVPPRINSII